MNTIEYVDLKKKPLQEALFEMRWELPIVNSFPSDPALKIVLGRMYEMSKDKFPYYESLPASSMPDEISAYNVQHRFRRGQDEWPLYQLGPGILSVNTTKEYVWKSFKDIILTVADNFINKYSDLNGDIKINYLMLRYINLIRFSNYSSNYFTFLRENMKYDISYCNELMSEFNLKDGPASFRHELIFNISKPNGSIKLIYTGEPKGKVSSLLWEILFSTDSFTDKPLIDDIELWLEDSHRVIETWFFNGIDDKLSKEFK